MLTLLALALTSNITPMPSDAIAADVIADDVIADDVIAADARPDPIVARSPPTPGCPDGDVASHLRDLVPGSASLILRVDDDGVGHLRLRLPWSNESSGPASAEIAIGAAGGLLAVQRARVVGGKDAAFVEASIASERWSAFTSALENGVEPEAVKAGKRRIGLHVSDGDDVVSVEVAAACSVRSLVVDVDALIDPVPAQGGWRFVVPAPLLRSSLKVEAPAGHLVYVDGKRGDRQQRQDSDDVGGFVVDVSRPGAAILARGGVSVLVPKAAPASPTADPVEPMSTAPFTLLRAAVDLPSPLSAAPPELRVVFVVDTSVSAGDTGVAMALSIVNAFLDEAPDDVGWALVTSSRTPHLLVPPWRSKQQRHLPVPAIENGSDVAAAIALAERIASDALAGSGRVVVLSDLQLKDRDVERLPVQISSGGRSGPLLHVVQLPADVGGATHPTVGFDRIFAGDDVRAYATERTGGVLLHAWEGDGGSVRELGRHLVRPTRLDQPVLLVDRQDAHEVATGSVVHVFSDDGDDDDTSDSLPNLLLEGGGLRASLVLPGRRSNAVVVGSLWASPVTLPLTQTKAGRALGLAVMANADLSDVLDDDQVRAAALSGRFVSRVTSLVDVPQWRPAQPEGLRGYGCSCGGCGCHGFSSRCGSGCRIGTGAAVVLKTQEILDQMAEEAAERCKVKKVGVDVEFGDREILDLKVEGGDACVSAYFWKQRLDQRIDDTSFEAHATRRASFQAPEEEPAAEDDGDG